MFSVGDCCYMLGSGHPTAVCHHSVPLATFSLFRGHIHRSCWHFLIGCLARECGVNDPQDDDDGGAFGVPRRACLRHCRLSLHFVTLFPHLSIFPRKMSLLSPHTVHQNFTLHFTKLHKPLHTLFFRQLSVEHHALCLVSICVLILVKNNELYFSVMM